MKSFKTYISEKRRYGHTLWIDPKGKVIDLPTGAENHFTWIATNFKKLFGRDPINDSEIFDVPMIQGWVRIRNHTSDIDIYGEKKALKKQGKMIWKVIDNRVLSGDDVNVGITWEVPQKDGTTETKRGPYVDLPEEEQKLFPHIGRP
jgi:hypothetical protein